MAQYPDTPNWNYSCTIEPEWNTVISKLDTTGKGAGEQRRAKAAYPVYNVSLQYSILVPSEFRTIWAFYMARKGALEPLHFYPKEPDTYAEQLYVGLADGTETIFDIPGKSTSDVSVYLDGALQSSGYEILSGGGDSDSDRVSFTSAPASGVEVSCTLTGLLRIRCRFKDDKLTKEQLAYMMYKTSIELKGLPPA